MHIKTTHVKIVIQEEKKKDLGKLLNRCMKKVVLIKVITSNFAPQVQKTAFST